MKNLLLTVLIFISTNVMAFCSIGNNACQQQERMIQLQEQQIKNQEAALRLQQQQQIDNQFRGNQNSGCRHYDATNGRCWE